jgi:hypothetical protein
MKMQENKDNFLENKVKNDRNKGKDNGINFLKLNLTLKIRINRNRLQLQQLQKTNKNQVGKILLIILLNKAIFLLFKKRVKRKILHFHKIMKKYVGKCKENNVYNGKNRELIRIFELL